MSKNAGPPQNRHFLWDVIFKITAYNFNAAIQHGRLAVEVDEDDVLEDADKMGVRRLDADTLRGVLEHESEHKRSARKHSFFYGLRPSGQHAYAAYLTLEKALQDTAKWIKNRIPEVSTENYSPDDFLVVETGGEGPGGGAKPYAMWGAPVVIRRSGATQPSVATPISPPPGSRSSKREPSKARPRTPRTASDALSFTSTVVPDRKGGHVIVLECTESVAEVLLSLRVDENTDVTCDRIWPDEDVPLRSCRIADESTATGRLTEDRRSIRLSGLSSGSVHRLTVEHAIPDELAETVRAPVFRVELRRLLLTGDDDADDG